jgi:hypothetical protein
MLLRTAIRDLRPRERLFVLPLEHEYTQASLAQQGSYALKGADRARHAALEGASGGGGELITRVGGALVCKAAAYDDDATEAKVLITQVLFDALVEYDEYGEYEFDDEDDSGLHMLPRPFTLA